MENVTGFIERDSSGVTLEVVNIGCYSEVLAYDNSTRSFPVRTNISNETCPIIIGEQLNSIENLVCTYVFSLINVAYVATNTSPTVGPDATAIVVGVLMVMAVMAVIFMIVVILLCKWKRCPCVRGSVDKIPCTVIDTMAR